MSKITQLANKIHLLTTTVPLFIILSNQELNNEINSTYTWEDKEGKEHTNNTQIFRKTIPLNYNQYDFAADRIHCHKKELIEISRDIERALLFGHRSENNNYKTMGGLDYFLPYATYPKSFLNSEQDFENFCRKMFLLIDHGLNKSSQIYVLSNSVNIELLAGAPWNRPKWVPEEKTYGIPVLEYISPYLNVFMIEEPFLKDDELFIIRDIGEFQLVSFKEGDLYMETDIHYHGTDDMHRDKDELLAEYGLKIFNIKNNFYIKLE